MAKRMRRNLAVATINPARPAYDVGEQLGEFTSRFGSWWSNAERAGAPVYALPAQVIETLSAGRATAHYVRVPAVLTPDEANAERAFHDLCLRLGPDAIGFIAARLIRYPALGLQRSRTGGAAFPTAEQLKRFFPKEPDERRTERSDIIQRKFTDFEELHLTRVGELLFCDRNREFRQQLRALRAEHDRLLISRQNDEQTREALRFPLSVPVSTPNIHPLRPDELLRVPTDVNTFRDSLKHFLWKWELANLETWDLPRPQGILENMPASFVVNLLGPNAPVTFIPSHIPVPPGTHSQDAIRDLQKSSAERTSTPFALPANAASAKRPSQWANAARLFVIDVALNRRYGKRRGTIACINRAFATMLGLRDEGHVARLRSMRLRAERD